MARADFSANVLVMAFLLKVVKALGLAPHTGDFIASLPQTVILLLGNLLIIGVGAEYHPQSWTQRTDGAGDGACYRG